MRLLIIEDSEDDALLVEREFRTAGHKPFMLRIQTADELRAALQEEWDAVISDFSLPSFNALEALDITRESGRDLPFIVVSGSIGEDVAVATMKRGASDYILKDKMARLVAATEREIREAENRTEKRRVMDELRQSQKLEAIGQLTGGVAHDFNNILTIIFGCAETILEDAPQGSAIHDMAQMTIHAAERGADLTHRLLAFARRQALKPSPVQMNRFVSDMMDMLKRTIGEDISVSTSLASDLWIANIDKAELQTALVNLVINARDAMPEGGRLTIETENIEFDRELPTIGAVAKPGRYVMLAVSDTGTGMSSELLERVIEPFFTTKPEGKGSGLGLSMVHGFVAQLGGHLKIYSEVGYGTSVKLFFPCADENAEDRREASEQSTAHSVEGGETVLVVEDERLVRDFVIKHLNKLGYKLLEAGSGAEAMGILESGEKIDLLFTDVVMPGGMTGRQLADQARALRPDLKILYTTGYTRDAILHQGRLEEGVRLLHKPFRGADLAKAVREALDD